MLIELRYFRFPLINVHFSESEIFLKKHLEKEGYAPCLTGLQQSHRALGVQESPLHRSLGSSSSVALLYHRRIVTVCVTGVHS